MPILTLTPTSAPAGPLTATPDPDLARVALVLDWPQVTAATIYRVGVDGVSVRIRGGDPATLVGGSWSGFDYEAPSDVTISYQAVAGGLTQSSPGIILPSFGRTWLKHPGLPVLNRPVNVQRMPQLSRASTSVTLAILGRSNPIVLSQRRAGVVGSFDVWTDTDDAKAGLWGLLEDGSPVLFSPPGDVGVAAMWMAVGDVSETRVTDTASEPVRVWQLPFTVVDRPVDLVITTTYDWAAVVDEFASWSDVVSKVGSWSELVAHGAISPPVPAP